MPKINDLTLALKRVPTIAYLYAALGVAAIGAWQGFIYHEREVGKRDLLIAQHEQTEKSLRHTADSLAKAYHVDTLRFTVYRTRFDTLVVNVDRWKRDTLRVVEFVRQADSTVAACTQALQTCDQRTATLQRGWDGARAEIALLKKNAPSKAKPWLYGIAGIGVGVLAERLRK